MFEPIKGGIRQLLAMLTERHGRASVTESEMMPIDHRKDSRGRKNQYAQKQNKQISNERPNTAMPIDVLMRIHFLSHL